MGAVSFLEVEKGYFYKREKSKVLIYLNRRRTVYRQLGIKILTGCSVSSFGLICPADPLKAYS